MIRKKRRRNYLISAKSLRKNCPVDQAGIIDIQYKDIEFLKCFLTEKGKIIPRRISGVTMRNQRMLTAAIKRARNMALLSFTEGYVPQFEETNESQFSTQRPRFAGANESPVPAEKTTPSVEAESEISPDKE